MFKFFLVALLALVPTLTQAMPFPAAVMLSYAASTPTSLPESQEKDKNPWPEGPFSQGVREKLNKPLSEVGKIPDLVHELTWKRRRFVHPRDHVAMCEGVKVYLYNGVSYSYLAGKSLEDSLKYVRYDMRWDSSYTEVRMWIDENREKVKEALDLLKDNEVNPEWFTRFNDRIDAICK